MTMDLERGTMRQWAMGRDGVKRWADTNEPHDNDAHDRQYGCAEDGCDCETPNAGVKR